MTRISHSIELKLNSAGYKGNEIDGILPHFMIDRKTLIGLTWYRSVEGPERYVLIITIGAILANVTKVFIEELSKDIYEWIKTKLQDMFNRKTFPVGRIFIRCKDVEIEYFSENNIGFLDLWLILPNMLEKIDVSKSKEWEIIYSESGDWSINPISEKDS